MTAFNGSETLAALGVQAALFEALLLAAAAMHKAATWDRAVPIAQRFVGLPRRLAAPGLVVIVILELGTAGLLALPAQRATGAVVAAVLWCCYLALIVRAIATGRRDADCGCSFGPSARPLGAFQVLRNGVLAGLAVMVFWTAREGTGVMQGSQVLGACALLALYGAVDQVMGLRPLRGGEIV